ncbi:mannitol-1-phosphate 5-dehydrogenase [uncultured Amnibacterium sp.]|uniref:mannitol-1-phosphate 5-dehydrogenase n=1 Tax=uncultured Amnibacterium sp. TaxID=1631851 RepID=UPI0035CB360E
MKAVHFGAGNIGRGFVGDVLAASGYEVVFADVDQGLIDALQAEGSYTVRQVGREHAHRVSGIRAVHSTAEQEQLIDEIATADLVTTAVGVRNLPAVAPVIARGIQRRVETGEDVIEGDRRLAVIACENAIDATGFLESEVRLNLPESEADALSAVALFAGTAIDRIVPGQPAGAGLDVTLEPFFEWIIDRTPFAGAEPEIAGVHWTDDLAPYLERKLFTVNTGHAVAAYQGFVRGIHAVTDAMADPAVLAEVRAAVAETRALLIAKHALHDTEQAAYGDTSIGRLANPDLPDTVERVGRGPLRKLGRDDRLIGPAAQLAERGLPRDALLRAVAAALRFDVPDDPESAELQRILRNSSPAQALRRVTGIPVDHPLHDQLLAVFQGARTE